MRAGGGGNAREIRTRKTKKKNRREEESDDETATTQSTHTLRNSFSSVCILVNTPVNPFVFVTVCVTVCVGKPAETVFLTVQEIVEVLEKRVCDCPEETLELIAYELVRYH